MHRCSTFLYVPNAFPLTFRKILLRTGLPTSIMHSCRRWVTCPQEALAITFLYVPDTFLYVPWGPLTFGFVGSPPSCTLVAAGSLVLKRHLLLRSYTFLIRSYTFRGALSLLDLLAPAAPGLDSAFWGTSHQTWPRLNQIVDFQ